MNSKKIFLFVILILLIIIPCFLGNCYYEGFTNSANSINFYNNIDGIEMNVSVTKTPTGISVLMDSVNIPINVQPVNLIASTNNNNTYHDQNGKVATITNDSNGLRILTLSDPNYPENDLVFKEKLNTNTNTNSNTNTSNISTNSNSSLSINNSTSNSTNNNSLNTNSSNGYFDNYNHFTKTSYPSIFYGPNGSIANVIQTGTSTSIILKSLNGETMTLTSNSNGNNTFTGSNGYTANISSDSNGKQTLNVQYAGANAIFTPDTPTVPLTNTNTNTNTIQGYNLTNNNKGYNNNSYSASNNNSNNNSNSNASNTSNNSFLAQGINNNNNNNNTLAQGVLAQGINNNSNNYNSSLPQGIPGNQIPPGQEDLYILKSQVVPPVCPVCPEPIVKCPQNIDLDQCPPCPACARCSEPSFDCKKVPNYNAFNPQDMPVPVLNDFASFGM